MEHHFLDEYSHSSAPEVFSPPPRRTRTIRLGHGIRQVIPTTIIRRAPPEGLRRSTSSPTGGSVRHRRERDAAKLGGFNIRRAKQGDVPGRPKRIANMMVLDPIRGFGASILDALPQHAAQARAEPASADGWPAPTATRSRWRRRTTSARCLLVRRSAEPRTWSDIYYGIIKSGGLRADRPRINANIIMVSELLAAPRPLPGRCGAGIIRVLRHLCAECALVAQDTVPGRTANLWGEYLAKRGDAPGGRRRAGGRAETVATGIQHARRTCAHLLAAFQEAGSTR